MVHPNSELRYINDQIGYGVVATRLIPRGTITWVGDVLDQVVTPAQIEQIAPTLRPLFEKYSWINGRGQSILCWDHARFINHSCEASCLSAGFDFEIAVRDILPGEEFRKGSTSRNRRLIPSWRGINRRLRDVEPFRTFPMPLRLRPLPRPCPPGRLPAVRPRVGSNCEFGLSTHSNCGTASLAARDGQVGG